MHFKLFKLDTFKENALCKTGPSFFVALVKVHFACTKILGVVVHSALHYCVVYGAVLVGNVVYFCSVCSPVIWWMGVTSLRLCG